MNNKLVEFNKSQKTSEMPKFRAGDVVKVFRKIIEGGKERIQVFEGMIISIKGAQSSSSMITVRKVSNGFGVEIVVPVQSPNIEKIELLKRAKTRSSKLYYVRERSAKSLKMKFTDAANLAKDEKKTPVVKAIKVEKVEAVVVEDVKAQEKAA
ncbi:MAG: 50S ribosomal protein L19 [Candidatus Moraniibacteriota bacterium]